MLFSFNLQKKVFSKKSTNPILQLNKPKKILFIISLLVLATFFSSCSPTRKANKKCRECPEFSMNPIMGKTSEQATF